MIGATACVLRCVCVARRIDIQCIPLNCIFCRKRGHMHLSEIRIYRFTNTLCNAWRLCELLMDLRTSWNRHDGWVLMRRFTTRTSVSCQWGPTLWLGMKGKELPPMVTWDAKYRNGMGIIYSDGYLVRRLGLRTVKWTS